MKKIVKILAFALILSCVTALLASCDGSLPEHLQDLERGDRVAFSEEGLKGIEHKIKITESSKNNATIVTKIDAFNDNFEYLRCKITIKFTATVIFEDQTEGVVNEVLELVLSFDGDEKFEHKISTEKKVHSVYNETYEIIAIEGEMIKK